MSETTELTISFSGDGDGDVSPSLEMYQDLDEELLGYPSLRDVSSMIAYARAGRSARQAFINNPYIKVYGDDVIINLDFFVRVYPTSLEYNLETNYGEISEATIEEVEYNESKIIEMTDTLTFDTEIQLASLEWISNIYDSAGDIVIAPPSYTISGNEINFSQTVFGVVKIRYTINEHKYTLNMNIPKTDIYNTLSGERVINQSLTGFNPIVMAKYMNGDDEESTELEIKYPKIVSDFLETCQFQDKLIIEFSEEVQTLTTYYYSTCTGEILDTHRTEL